MKYYEFIDHTADIMVKAYGDTVEEAFGAAAGAMFDIITGGAAIERNDRVHFEVESLDLEGLLVGFLSQLIVFHEVDNLVLGRFEVSIPGRGRLVADAWGERFDATRHGGGVQVKGVSYHMIEVVEGQAGEASYVQVLFDV